MLAESVVTTNVAVSDLERARSFYVDALGLRVKEEPVEPVGEDAVVLVAGDGTRLRLYRGEVRPSERPVALFAVPDVQRAVEDLSRRGVRFEGIDQPGTADVAAVQGAYRSAWFRDPDGNVLGIHRALR